MNKSLISCVSLGPGEAELITLKALRVLQQADLIYCPGTREKSRSFKILRELEIEEGKVELFEVTMSKDRSIVLNEYRAVAEEMMLVAKQGKRVAVVAEGDSGFYSSARYITDLIQNDSELELQVIPGVPAFIACGARAGLHVVKQEESLWVITSGLTLETIQEGLENHRSMVVMKLSQHRKVVKEALLRFPEAEFHYFENIGVADEEFYSSNRDEIAHRDIPYFSILIIKNRG